MAKQWHIKSEGLIVSKIVLYVDDSKTALIALQQVTDDLDIELLQYESAIDALEDLKKNLFTPDLVITDLNMPDMDGFTFLKNLKDVIDIKILPTLMCTTESSDELKSLGKDIGLTGWITKPYSQNKLKVALQRVLRI